MSFEKRLTLFNTDGSHGRLSLWCLCCVLFAPLGVSQEKNVPQSAEPLAIFAGQSIDEKQLSQRDADQLRSMMEQVFFVQNRAVEAALGPRLLQADAKKKGISVEDLLKELNSNVAEPSDDQVRAYYAAHQSQINKPVNEARDSIRQGLKSEAIQEAQTHYVWGLMQQAVNSGELVMLTRPPKLHMSPDPTRMKGDSHAPITIVEFSDFSCPSCQKAESTISAVLAKYPGKIKVGYRDFLNEQANPQTKLAAEASRCAAEQGKFWEYHDLLFANVAKRSHEDLIGYARSLKLDDNQFASCLSTSKYDSQIEQDLRMGFNAGMIIPPGFFINGRFIDGPPSQDAFEKMIDDELNQVVQQPSQSAVSAKQN